VCGSTLERGGERGSDTGRVIKEGGTGGECGMGMVEVVMGVSKLESRNNKMRRRLDKR